MTALAEQASLLDLIEQPAKPSAGLTAADLDEWIADVERSTHDTGHWPNEWALAGLADSLGEAYSYPHRFTKAELLPLLRRALASALLDTTGGTP